MADVDTSNPTPVAAPAENNSVPAAASDANDSRDIAGLTEDHGVPANTAAVVAVPAAKRDFKEEAEHLARETEAKVLDAVKAGKEYLFPDSPKSAQNPLKRAVIAYKTAREDVADVEKDVKDADESK